MKVKTYKLNSYLFSLLTLLLLYIPAGYAYDIEASGECYGEYQESNPPANLPKSLQHIVKLNWRVQRLADLNYAKIKWYINDQEVGYLRYENPDWYSSSKDLSVPLKVVEKDDVVDIPLLGKNLIFNDFRPVFLAGRFWRQQKTIDYEISIDRTNPNNILMLKLNNNEIIHPSCKITQIDADSEAAKFDFYPKLTDNFGNMRKEYLTENKEGVGICFFQMQKNSKEPENATILSEIFKFQWNTPYPKKDDKNLTEQIIELNEQQTIITTTKNQISHLDRDRIPAKFKGAFYHNNQKFLYSISINRDFREENEFFKINFQNMQTKDTYSNINTSCFITKNVPTDWSITSYEPNKEDYVKAYSIYRLQKEKPGFKNPIEHKEPEPK
ncbi:MAG: hypothetical protein K0R94_169 [Burkholderiales bacterium]|jgi:hypothetical protein|nr:hypothetical protein [Burkholderiales bacterium]